MYNTTRFGLKIEMLYRKVGTFVWYPAFNDKQQKVVLLDIKPNTVVDVSIECVYYVRRRMFEMLCGLRYLK